MNAARGAAAGGSSTARSLTIVRVIRNLAGMPFAWRADPAAAALVATRVLSGLRGLRWRFREVARGRIRAARIAWMLPPRPGEHPDVRLLWTPGRNAIPEWVLLLNGVDHLVMQHARPGLVATATAAATLGRMARLERRAPFARAPRWGWLASSPADCGVGLRVLWLRPGHPPTAGTAPLSVAGVAAASAGAGWWQATHLRPLGAAPDRTLRRCEEALHALARERPAPGLPRYPAPAYHVHLR